MSPTSVLVITVIHLHISLLETLTMNNIFPNEIRRTIFIIGENPCKINIKLLENLSSDGENYKFMIGNTKVSLHTVKEGNLCNFVCGCMFISYISV